MHHNLIKTLYNVRTIYEMKLTPQEVKCVVILDWWMFIFNIRRLLMIILAIAITKQTISLHYTATELMLG